MTTTAIPTESATGKPKAAPVKKAVPPKKAPSTAGLPASVASVLKDGGSAAGRHMVQLPLSQIIDSPDNPREHVGDVDGLAASIKAVGLLEPVLVVPATAYRAGNNQLPDKTDDGKYVLIAGHRRAAACRQLKMSHVDAIVETGTVGAQARVAMIVENFQRVDLTPLEEAKAFAELDQLGLKQDEIATQVGCSQSHISKRLGLLKLDPVVQEAVVKKVLPIADALELGKLNETGRQVAALKDLTTGHVRDAKVAVEIQKREQKKAEDRAKAKKLLADQKIAEVKKLVDLFGYSHYQYQLNDAELKKHKGMDCLVAHIDDWDSKLKYYCKAKKKCAAYPKGKPAKSAAEINEAREKKAAAEGLKARREHAAKLAPMPVPGSELLEFLTEQFVKGTDYAMQEARPLAAAWLREAVPGLPIVGSRPHFTEVLRVVKTDKAFMTKYVSCLRMALLETRASLKHGRWDVSVAMYLYELSLKTGGAYTPTRWELDRLTKDLGIEDPEAFMRTGKITRKAVPCGDCKQLVDPAELVDDEYCKPCDSKYQEELLAEQAAVALAGGDE